MDAESLRELQQKDAAGWARITAHLDAHPEGRVHGDGSDPWTSTAVYAHLGRWFDHSTELVEAARDGRPAPTMDASMDEVNARWRQEDADLTLDEARGRANRAHDRYLAAVASLPEELWTETIERNVIADGWDHYDHHLRYTNAER